MTDAVNGEGRTLPVTHVPSIIIFSLFPRPPTNLPIEHHMAAEDIELSKL